MIMQSEDFLRMIVLPQMKGLNDDEDSRQKTNIGSLVAYFQGAFGGPTNSIKTVYDTYNFVQPEMEIFFLSFCFPINGKGR